MSALSAIRPASCEKTPTMNTAEETPKETVERVTTLATEKCHNACDQAKEMIRRNPLPTVLGALAFGAAIGYAIYSRRDCSVADRLVKESRSFGRQLSGAQGKLSGLFHDGLGLAHEGAGRANRFVHDLPADQVLDNVSKTLHRALNRINRLKFW